MEINLLSVSGNINVRFGDMWLEGRLKQCPDCDFCDDIDIPDFLSSSYKSHKSNES